MPTDRPLLTRPRALLASLRARAGALRVTWPGRGPGGRGSLLAVASRLSPLAALAPASAGRDPGTLTHRGRVTRVHDESASVERQTLLPSDPKPQQVTLQGLSGIVRPPAPQAAPPQLTSPPPVLVPAPAPSRPEPPEDDEEPPTVARKPRLRAKAGSRRLMRQVPSQVLATARPLPGPLPAIEGAPPMKATRASARVLWRLSANRRPIRVMMLASDGPIGPTVLAVLPPPASPRGRKDTTPGRLGSGRVEPTPPPQPNVAPSKTVSGATVAGSPGAPSPAGTSAAAKPLPGVPLPVGALGQAQGTTGAPPPVGAPITRTVRVPPPRLPPRPTPTAQVRPSARPRSNAVTLRPAVALGLVATQVASDRALGRLSAAPQGPPQSASAPPSVLLGPLGPTRPRASGVPPLPGATQVPPGLSRLRASSLPGLGRGARLGAPRFTPEVTTVVPALLAAAAALPPSTPPPRAPTLLERARGATVAAVLPAPERPLSASAQLKATHDLSDYLDKVAASVPKTRVGGAPAPEGSAPRRTSAEWLEDSRALSARLDSAFKPKPGPDATSGSGRKTAAQSLQETRALSDRLAATLPPRRGRSASEPGTRTPTDSLLKRSASLGLAGTTLPNRSTDPTTVLPKTQGPPDPEVNPVYAEDATRLAKRAAAAWWPTWTELATRPPPAKQLVFRFARALEIADLKSQKKPLDHTRARLRKLEAEEAVDLGKLGSNLSLDMLLERPSATTAAPSTGGARPRSVAVLSRPASLLALAPTVSPTPHTGAPTPMRDTGTPHTVLPGRSPSLLDSEVSGTTNDAPVKSTRGDRFPSNVARRFSDKATVIDAWRKGDIRDTDFDDDDNLRDMVLKDLEYEKTVLHKRPETRERTLQQRLTRASHRSSDATDEAPSHLIGADRVRWERASALASRARQSWWPTWTDVAGAPPPQKTVAERYVQALEFVELRDKTDRTPEQNRRLRELLKAEVQQRNTAGSWLHLDQLLKRPSATTRADGRVTPGRPIETQGAPIVMQDDAEHVILPGRPRSDSSAPPPPTVVPPMPPAPKPTPQPTTGEGDALATVERPEKVVGKPDARVKTAPGPTVDEVIARLSDRDLATLVERVLTDRQSGGAVMQRAMDLIERRARLGALRDVR